MSTKIYYGYKVNTNNFQELFNLSIELKNDLKKIADKLYQEAVFTECISKLDQYYFFKKDIPNRLYLSVLSDFRDRKRKILKDGYRDSLHDFDCDWCFIPINKEYVLSIIYTEQNAYREHFKNHPLIEYYGYWDNTDADENCSEEEWEQRKKDWSILNYDPVCSQSFNIKLYSDYQHPKPLIKNEITNEIFQKYIDNENRIKYLLDIMLTNYFSENILKDENINFSKIIQQRTQWKKTEEYTVKCEEFKKYIIENLKQYTIDDL